MGAAVSLPGRGASAPHRPVGGCGRGAMRGARRIMNGFWMGKLMRLRRDNRQRGSRCRGKCCQHQYDTHIPQHKWRKRRNQSYSSIGVPAFMQGIQPGTAESDNWKPGRRKKFSRKVEEGRDRGTERPRDQGTEGLGTGDEGREGHSRKNDASDSRSGVQSRARALPSRFA